MNVSPNRDSEVSENCIYEKKLKLQASQFFVACTKMLNKIYLHQERSRRNKIDKRKTMHREGSFPVSLADESN